MASLGRSMASGQGQDSPLTLGAWLVPEYGVLGHLAPLTLSQDLVSHMLPNFLVAN